MSGFAWMAAAVHAIPERSTITKAATWGKAPLTVPGVSLLPLSIGNREAGGRVTAPALGADSVAHQPLLMRAVTHVTRERERLVRSRMILRGDRPFLPNDQSQFKPLF
jgi:hypothetical protein